MSEVFSHTSPSGGPRRLTSIDISQQHGPRLLDLRPMTARARRRSRGADAEHYVSVDDGVRER